jgi:hypothetical protein
MVVLTKANSAKHRQTKTAARIDMVSSAAGHSIERCWGQVKYGMRVPMALSGETKSFLPLSNDAQNLCDNGPPAHWINGPNIGLGISHAMSRKVPRHPCTLSVRRHISHQRIVRQNIGLYSTRHTVLQRQLSAGVHTPPRDLYSCCTTAAARWLQLGSQACVILLYSTTAIDVDTIRL